MNKPAFLLFFSLFTTFSGYSQQVEWKSLLTQINDSITSGSYEGAKQLAEAYLEEARVAQNDSILAELYYGIAIGNFRYNTEEGILYLDSAVLFAQRGNVPLMNLRALNARSSFESKLGRLQEAKNTSLNALTLARTEVPDQLFLSVRNVSINYRMLAKYDSALYFVLIADSIATALENPRFKYLALQGASNIYLDMENYEAAIQIIPQLLQGETSSDKMFELMNLGMAYRGLSRYDSALHYFNESFKIAQALKDTIVMATLLEHVGEVHLKSTNYDQAIHFLSQADEFLAAAGPDDLITSNGLKLASALFEQKEYDKALQKAKNAHLIAIELGHQKFQLAAVQLLAKITAAQGKYKSAHEYDQVYQALYSQLNERERVETIEELKTLYETERKEQEIASLAQQNKIKDLQLVQQRIIFFSLTAVLLLVLSLAIIAYRSHKSRSKQRQLVLEQNLLRTQMNPHFIFNALASIQGFITRNKRKEAATYLAKFGELTRDILEASREELIPIEKELEMIRNYVSLENARFSKSLDLQVELTGMDPGDELLVPPMMIQPFLENAIKHGFKGRDSGRIEVGIEKNEKSLHLSVTDNGVGLDEKALTTDGSLAIKITQDRLIHLKKYAKNLQLKIANVRNPTGKVAGARVTLNLPIIYAH